MKGGMGDNNNNIVDLSYIISDNPIKANDHNKHEIIKTNNHIKQEI